MTEPPESTHEQLVTAAEQQIQALIDDAIHQRYPVKTAVREKTYHCRKTSKLNTVLDYIDEVQAIDMSKAPGIGWPEKT